jgi:hypothetical protein
MRVRARRVLMGSDEEQPQILPLRVRMTVFRVRRESLMQVPFDFAQCRLSTPLKSASLGV